MQAFYMLSSTCQPHSLFLTGLLIYQFIYSKRMHVILLPALLLLFIGESSGKTQHNLRYSGNTPKTVTHTNDSLVYNFV